MFDDVTGLILDGGRARRMGGRRKAFLEVAGRPIAERTLELFGRLFPEVLVATDRPGPWAGLPVRCVPDPLPGAGPLAGLVAGLEAAGRPLVFVVAGDMPRLSEALVRELVERARRLPGHALVPRQGGRAQVLHAVYPAAMAPAARAALAGGTRRLTDLLASARVAWLEEDEAAALPGGLESFRDVDTPRDLEAENRP